MRYDPADSIIRRLGGAANVARVTGRSLTRVYRWTYPKGRNGTGGTVPMGPARLMLDYARAEGIDLSPADFLAEPRLIDAHEEAR